MLSSSQHLFDTYIGFHRLYLAKIAGIIAPYRLHPAQWGVMKRLYFSEPLTVARLARLHAVETPTMTDIVKKLEARGYLQGHPGEDKREKHCSLTDKGNAVCKELLPTITELNDIILEGTSLSEQQLCADLFAKITLNIQSSK